MIQAHLGYALNRHHNILLRPDHVFTKKVYELEKRCYISLSITRYYDKEYAEIEFLYLKGMSSHISNER